MIKKMFIVITLFMTFFIFSFTSVSAIDMPNGNLGYVVYDKAPQTLYFTGDVSDTYLLQFYSTNEAVFISLVYMFSYMDNVESTSRLYTVNSYEEWRLFFDDTVIDDISIIYFEYSLLGSSSSYMRVFNREFVEVYSVTMNLLNSSYKFLREVNYNTVADVAYAEGRHDGLLDGYEEFYSYGSDYFGYDESESFDFKQGIIDFYTYGSVAYSKDKVLSFDFIDGSSTGYALGLEDGYDFNPTGFIQTLFYGIGYLFAVELIPGLKIGTIALMVLMLKLLPFIIGLFSGGKKD